jgi:hypothetical protein
VLLEAICAKELLLHSVRQKKKKKAKRALLVERRTSSMLLQTARVSAGSKSGKPNRSSMGFHSFVNSSAEHEKER